jgi:hypothetical protein
MSFSHPTIRFQLALFWSTNPTRFIPDHPSRARTAHAEARALHSVVFALSAQDQACARYAVGGSGPILETERDLQSSGVTPHNWRCPQPHCTLAAFVDGRSSTDQGIDSNSDADT